MFVCTTRRENTVYDAIIESVAGQVYRRLAPDEVNRVLKGLENLEEFFGAGMRNRAGATGGVGESYRILTGSSVLGGHPKPASDGHLKTGQRSSGLQTLTRRGTVVPPPGWPTS